MDSLQRQRLANKIRQLMQQKGWNQAELARRSGITADNLSRHLSCKYDLKINNLTRIAEALNVEVTELLDDVDEQVEGKYCIELKTLKDDPTKALLKIHQLLPTAVAVQIINLVNEARSSQTSTADLRATCNQGMVSPDALLTAARESTKDEGL